MKRFYKTAEAGTAPGGFAIRLDGKPVKTPLGRPLLIASQKLAEAVAAEWAAQGEEIIPGTMPLTQLANTLIDKAHGPDREEMNEQVADYGASDLVCYFATHPQELIKRHEHHWSPLLAWLEKRHGVMLDRVSGIQYYVQPEDSLHRLEKLIQGLNDRDFTIVQAATATTGSLVIALALLDGHLSPEAAHHAACVDEFFQLEKWGEDKEARDRLEATKAELAAIAKFRDLA